jgi:prepilin-type N-terminal cleavage/methylation domain-containing protein
MNVSRGLTLLEVLASVVLLTMLAAACLPLLQKATRTIAETQAQSSSEFLVIAEFADKLLKEPATFGVSDLAEIETLSLSWPDHPELEQITIEKFTAPMEQSGSELKEQLRGAWLKIECNGEVVYRWIPLPAQDLDTAP